MGYSTDFYGSFKISPVMDPKHIAYINEFSRTRRMGRLESEAEKLSDPLRRAVELPIGANGAFFVGSGDNNPDRVKEKGDSNFAGQQHDNSIIDYNRPPGTQPSLWCQWVITEDGKFFKWDDGEKFYEYVEWLQYIIDNFLIPWGYVLNGEINWEGEEQGDLGIITTNDNQITLKEGHIEYK